MFGGEGLLYEYVFSPVLLLTHSGRGHLNCLNNRSRGF